MHFLEDKLPGVCLFTTWLQSFERTINSPLLLPNFGTTSTFLPLPPHFSPVSHPSRCHFHCIFPPSSPPISLPLSSHLSSNPSSPLSQPTHAHIGTASILLLCTIGMTYVDTSALYHVVRGQSVIKLYVIYNMLEVGVRYCAV